MSEKKISSLINSGYTKYIPKDANLDDFDKIFVKSKLGKKTTLYRHKLKKKEIIKERRNK